MPKNPTPKKRPQASQGHPYRTRNTVKCTCPVRENSATSTCPPNKHKYNMPSTINRPKALGWALVLAIKVHKAGLARAPNQYMYSLVKLPKQYNVMSALRNSMDPSQWTTYNMNAGCTIVHVILYKLYILYSRHQWNVRINHTS